MRDWASDNVEALTTEIRESWAGAFEYATGDLAQMVLESDWLRDACAAAWDAGYSHCFDVGDDVRSLSDNPYRAAS